MLLTSNSFITFHSLLVLFLFLCKLLYNLQARAILSSPFQFYLTYLNWLSDCIGQNLQYYVD